MRMLGVLTVVGLLMLEVDSSGLIVADGVILVLGINIVVMVIVNIPLEVASILGVISIVILVLSIGIIEEGSGSILEGLAIDIGISMDSVIMLMSEVTGITIVVLVVLFCAAVFKRLQKIACITSTNTIHFILPAIWNINNT